MAVYGIFNENGVILGTSLVLAGIIEEKMAKCEATFERI